MFDALLKRPMSRQQDAPTNLSYPKRGRHFSNDLRSQPEGCNPVHVLRDVHLFSQGLGTGYLGRHLCTQHRKRWWRVRALVRDVGRAHEFDADHLIEAKATQPHTLAGVMDGADLVISALGITRQGDGLGYRDVDFQANLNLLDEARCACVPHFAYMHVLNAVQMAHVPKVTATAAFVRALLDADIASTVIAPSGYFSDMTDFMALARPGRVWLYKGGAYRINPIYGTDRANATADAIDRGQDWLDVGGPDVFSQFELVETGFSAIGKPSKITWLPDWLRRVALVMLPRLSPRHIHGPAVFFLTVLGVDMVGAPHGTLHLDAHLAALTAGWPVHVSIENNSLWQCGVSEACLMIAHLHMQTRHKRGNVASEVDWDASSEGRPT